MDAKFRSAKLHLADRVDVQSLDVKTIDGICASGQSLVHVVKWFQIMTCLGNVNELLNTDSMTIVADGLNADWVVVSSGHALKSLDL